MEDKLVLKKESFEPIKGEWLKQSGLDERVFSKEVSFALQCLSNNPYMQGASKESLLKSVMNVAQVGLTLNPVSKLAYLVPRYNAKKKTLEAVLDPSYQGYVKLLTDSGSILSLQCNLVFEGDEFEFDFSSDKKVTKHKPHFLVGNAQGSLLCAYSIATLPNGAKHVEIMSKEDIYNIRERSESYKSFKDGKTQSCIWLTDEGEMCRKTVVKRHYKYLPKSGNLEKIETAIGLDNTVNGFKPSYGKLTMIDKLIHNSEFGDDEKRRYEDSLEELTDVDADRLINYLNQYQKKNMDEQLDNALRINE